MRGAPIHRGAQVVHFGGVAGQPDGLGLKPDQRLLPARMLAQRMGVAAALG